jgi:hypothetical protein
MLRREALVRTDVPEEFIASIIRVTRIGELRITLAVTSNRSTLRRNTELRLLVPVKVPSSPILVTLMMEALSFSKTSVITGVTRRNIPVEGILQGHRRENLESYMLVRNRPKAIQIVHNIVKIILLTFRVAYKSL